MWWSYGSVLHPLAVVAMAWNAPEVKHALPEPLYCKAVEHRLVRHQCHILDLRLRDQQSVERILVRDVQFAGDARMSNDDREFGKALLGDDRLEVVRERCGFR